MKRRPSYNKINKFMDEFKGIEYNPACPYLAMSDVDIDKLPAFNSDGTVAFYDIGDGYLLGKLALIRYRSVVKRKINK